MAKIAGSIKIEEKAVLHHTMVQKRGLSENEEPAEIGGKRINKGLKNLPQKKCFTYPLIAPTYAQVSQFLDNIYGIDTNHIKLCSCFFILSIPA